MAKNKERRAHFLELYDPDLKLKIAYLFPSEWSEQQKQKFRALSAQDKQHIAGPGSGFVHWNNEELRVACIPSDALQENK